MDWLFGSAEMTEEERLHHLDEEKQKNFDDCIKDDHCKMRLADYLEGLRIGNNHKANHNIAE